MQNINSPEASFDFPKIRKLLAPYFEYHMATYWADFLLSITITWASFVLFQIYPLYSLQTLLFFSIAVCSGYRSVLFIHEIAHFKENSVPYFSFVWNLLCGIPFFAPSFMYRGVHNDHHSKFFYGTKEDGEYIPFGLESPKRLVLYLATSFISPIFLVLRFALLAPISWLIPSFRELVMSQLSSFVIDFEYIRPDKNHSKDSGWQEIACFFWSASIALAIYFHWIPFQVVFYWYAFCSTIFFMNGIRTIAAHRYQNSGEVISMEAQFYDSVNIDTTNPITKLFCPVGLRYHALHHLFPTIPYHSLDKAHKKLMEILPETHHYRSTNEPGLYQAIQKLWNSSLQPRSTKSITSLTPNFFQKKIEVPPSKATVVAIKVSEK